VYIFREAVFAAAADNFRNASAAGISGANLNGLNVRVAP